ncbi:hypothetical protein [Streptomyces axinellae]|uniref:Uncharacterized protein n=1 Tax=Streptomyces axinellae TaxID=552788 RepID=A0ABN3QDQ8_9ACTN
MPTKLPGEGEEWDVPLMPHQSGGRRPALARPATPPWVDPTPPWADQPSQSPTPQTTGNGQESRPSDLPAWLADARNDRRGSDVSTVSGLGSETGERVVLERPMSYLPDWAREAGERARRDEEVDGPSNPGAEVVDYYTRNNTATPGQLPSNPLRGVRDTQRAAFGPGSPTPRVQAHGTGSAPPTPSGPSRRQRDASPSPTRQVRGR